MNWNRIFLFTLVVAGAALFSANSRAQTNVAIDAAKAANDAENAQMRKEWESWNTPFKPFRIIGNIYYVGVSGISSFLVTTSEGHILIDTGFDTTAPRIRDSVSKLGFKLSDIKVILNSHAHGDHVGGDRLMKEWTGAKIMMTAADADLLASGGTNDFTPYSDEMKRYPSAKADRIVRDGDVVELGGTKLVCHLTAGHTKGCTTWTMDVVEEGKTYHVVFFGSTTILPGVPLVKNSKYPEIAEDLAATYRKLKELPCDVFLAPHTSFFDLGGKVERLERGEKPNPFIDPAGYRRFIEKAEHTFVEQLEAERKKRDASRPVF